MEADRLTQRCLGNPEQPSRQQQVPDRRHMARQVSNDIDPCPCFFEVTALQMVQLAREAFALVHDFITPAVGMRGDVGAQRINRIPEAARKRAIKQARQHNVAVLIEAPENRLGRDGPRLAGAEWIVQHRLVVVACFRNPDHPSVPALCQSGRRPWARPQKPGRLAPDLPDELAHLLLPGDGRQAALTEDGA